MMMMMSEGTLVHHARTAGLLTATALAIASLTACSDNDPDPLFSTTSSSTATDSSTDTPTKPPTTSSSTASPTDASGEEIAELPETAQKHTKAGAIAFNKFYQLQMGEALKSGSTGTLKQYSHQDCDVCTNYIRRIDKRTAQGVHMDKNPNSVRDVTAEPRSDGGYKVTLTVDATKYHEVLQDGAHGRTADQVTYTLTTDTQWHKGHWAIRSSVLIK